MARNYKLQWLASSRRWRKQYKGKQYYFPLLDGETKATSYTRCLREWEAQKVEVDRANQTSTQPWLVDLLEQMQETFRKGQDASRFIVAAETLRLVRIAESRGIELPIDDDGTVIAAPRLPAGVQAARDHQDRYQEDLQMAIKARLGNTTPAHRPWEDDQEETPVDRTISKLLEQFQKAKPKADRHRIKIYRDWCDEQQDAAEINGPYCRRYYDHLVNRIEHDEIAPRYGKNLFETFAQFVRWLYREPEVLDQIPRNLEDLRFEVPTKQVEIFDIADVQRYLQAADGQLELYLLLMLNCGMTQIDIADLHPDEVKWQDGRVIRKRSKTKKRESVPVCDYLLWPRTLRLLKQFRSEDPEHVLLTSHGTPVATRRSDKGRNDSVRLSYKRLLGRLKEEPKPVLMFKKTSASLLNREFGHDVSQLFLGHAPRSVAQRHYIAEYDHRLDEPLLWLGEQYELVKE
ncbi:MAG: hypothetical protein WD049_05160 [Candidatus Paceibacterota bacterium]